MCKIDLFLEIVSIAFYVFRLYFLILLRLFATIMLREFPLHK